MEPSSTGQRFPALLTRRSFAASLLCLPLASCSDSEKVAVRYRVIARITYDGRPYEASTVMECSYRRIKHSLIGNGGSTRLLGEALIFDLPNGKTFFVLPFRRDRGGGLGQFYEHALIRTFGLKSSVGSLSDEDLARLKSASGRYPLFDKGGLPALVGFDDETKPNTIFEIAPFRDYPEFPGVRAMGEVSPGVSFEGIDVEITDDPVTDKLRDRLPWLDTTFAKQVFNRGRGNIAYRDSPIRHIITTTHFFGLGS